MKSRKKIEKKRGCRRQQKVVSAAGDNMVQRVKGMWVREKSEIIFYHLFLFI